MLSELKTFLNKHSRWMFVAILLPPLTIGMWLLVSSMTAYHYDEREAALDGAWACFVIGCPMILPSLISMVSAIGLSSALFEEVPDERQRDSLFKISTLLMHSIGLSAVYAGMLGLTSEKEPSSNSESLIFIVLLMTFSNVIVSPVLYGIASALAVVLPSSWNKRQRWIAATTILALIILCLVPPWWTHEAVFSEDQTDMSQSYLGHIPLFLASKVQGAGFCTQQFIVEASELLAAACVLLRLAELPSLAWQKLNSRQRRFVIAGFVSSCAGILLLPWAHFSSSNYCWSSHDPARFLGFYPFPMEPAGPHSQILWPLVWSEIYCIFLLTGIGVYRARNKKELGDDPLIEQFQTDPGTVRTVLGVIAVGAIIGFFSGGGSELFFNPQEWQFATFYGAGGNELALLLSWLAYGPAIGAFRGAVIAGAFAIGWVLVCDFVSSFRANS